MPTTNHNSHAGDVEKGLEEGPEKEAPTLEENAVEFMNHLASFTRTFDDDLATVEQRQASLGSRRGSSMFDVDEDLAYFVSKKIKVSMSFSGLTYSIPLKGKGGKGRGCCGGGGEPERKVILDNLSAEVPAGRLVAVMGPTGCGKTSLINALAGRLEAGGEVRGEVLVNGQPRGKAYRALVAYVTQDDVLFPNLTVQETFEFAARMRLPKKVSNKSKMRLVDTIINELGLSKARNTRIGNAMYRGVSGGERKRTNIGIELLSGASLIFLDEPTSGLDAFQAMNVMESLWMLSTSGRTIITTIHQPRSSIYKMFDLLLLLSEGRTMYYGPAKEAVGFFRGAHFECPVNFNPADFFLDVVSMDFRSKEAEDGSRERIQLLADRFESVRETYEGGIHQQHRRSIDGCDDCSDLSVVVFPNNPFTEFGLLLRRAWKQQSRDILPIAITVMQTVVVGFILAAIYSDMGSSSTPVQDELGILFFVCIFSAFGAMFQVGTVIIAARSRPTTRRSLSARSLARSLSRRSTPFPQIVPWSTASARPKCTTCSRTMSPVSSATCRLASARCVSCFLCNVTLKMTLSDSMTPSLSLPSPIHPPTRAGSAVRLHRLLDRRSQPRGERLLHLLCAAHRRGSRRAGLWYLYFGGGY